MNIGLIGLGRMGQAITHRLIQAHHTVYGYDSNANMRKTFETIGGTSVQSLQEITEHTNIIWLMVPAGKPVDDVLNVLIETFKHQDSIKNIIIDGGNSNFQDSIRRSQLLEQKNIFFLDCGTSGGIHGKELGFSLMIGGNKDIYTQIEPLFKAIASPLGYAYMGPTGAGHYVKMVHNGIEYALLQSYAEGFRLLKEGHYKNLDLEKISHVWQNGSIIRSWILDLTNKIFKQDQKFNNISGEIEENLTGRWTLQEAQKQNIPIDLIQRALEIRKESRQTGGNYATKIVALLRNQFGGHQVKKSGS